jgi:hypothetical protein
VLDFWGDLNFNSHKMTSTIGKTTRVIGWYHSHPHITVLPSHVGKRFAITFRWLSIFFPRAAVTLHSAQVPSGDLMLAVFYYP